MNGLVKCPDCPKMFTPHGIGPHRRIVHGHRLPGGTRAEAKKVYNQRYRARLKAEAAPVTEGPPRPRRKYQRRLPPVEPTAGHLVTEEFHASRCPQCGFRWVSSASQCND